MKAEIGKARVERLPDDLDSDTMHPYDEFLN